VQLSHHFSHSSDWAPSLDKSAWTRLRPPLFRRSLWQVRNTGQELDAGSKLQKVPRTRRMTPLGGYPFTGTKVKVWQLVRQSLFSVLQVTTPAPHPRPSQLMLAHYSVVFYYQLDAGLGAETQRVVSDSATNLNTSGYL